MWLQWQRDKPQTLESIEPCVSSLYPVAITTNYLVVQLQICTACLILLLTSILIETFWPLSFILKQNTSLTCQAHYPSICCRSTSLPLFPTFLPGWQSFAGCSGRTKARRRKTWHVPLNTACKFHYNLSLLTFSEPVYYNTVTVEAEMQTIQNQINVITCYGKQF